MYQTTVTIGRNIGTDPMRARDWTRFGDSVHAMLSPLATYPEKVETHTGMGSWVNADGTTSYEDSMHLTVRHPAPLTPTQIATLQIVLAPLAKTYGQEAIALATGPVFLVTPSRY